jgi:hypothetical protein
MIGEDLGITLGHCAMDNTTLRIDDANGGLFYGDVETNMMELRHGMAP